MASAGPPTSHPAASASPAPVTSTTCVGSAGSVSLPNVAPAGPCLRTSTPSSSPAPPPTRRRSRRPRRGRATATAPGTGRRRTPRPCRPRTGRRRPGDRRRARQKRRVGGPEQGVAGDEQPVGPVEPRTCGHVVKPGPRASVRRHRAVSVTDERDDGATALDLRADHVDALGRECCDGQLAGARTVRSEHDRRAAECDHPRRNVGCLPAGGEGDRGRGVVVQGERALGGHQHVEHDVADARDPHDLTSRYDFARGCP